MFWPNRTWQTRRFIPRCWVTCTNSVEEPSGPFCPLGYNCTDGLYPESSLTSDGAGNLYGTTTDGGAFAAGNVFELSPNGNGGWNETVLYSFTGGADGAYPTTSNLIFDSVGSLYGTAANGGANGYGVVFE